MTDPRIENLDKAIRLLPFASGIVFRHYDLPRQERRALFKHVQRIAKTRGHKVMLGDCPVRARQWAADGAHSRSAHRSHGIRTVAVHTMREASLARRIGADLIFVSPVFETRSHASARGIGPLGVGRIAGSQRDRTIVLGGMTARRARSLASLKIYGWAAIDAFRT